MWGSVSHQIRYVIIMLNGIPQRNNGTSNWVKRRSQRQVAESLNVSRKTLRQWEKNFVDYGALGLLPELSYLQIESDLERIIILIKSCLPHERSNLALRLAEALEIPGASLGSYPPSSTVLRLWTAHGREGYTVLSWSSAYSCICCKTKEKKVFNA